MEAKAVAEGVVVQDPQGKFRPWPVRYMQDHPTTVLDEAVRVHGRSLDLVGKSSWGSRRFANEQGKYLSFASGCWHIWGRQSFRVAPLLVDALRNTSLNLVPSSALRSPYAAIWVEADLGLDKAGHPDMGFFLMSGQVGSDPIFTIGPSGDVPFPVGTQALMACALKEGPGHPFVFVSNIFLCRETLEESIGESLAFSRKVRLSKNKAIGPEEKVDAINRGLWAYIANFLLYLSSPDPDLQVVMPAGLERPPKSEKAKEIQTKIRAREGELRAVGYRMTRVIRRGAGEDRTTPTDGDGAS